MIELTRENDYFFFVKLPHSPHERLQRFGSFIDEHKPCAAQAEQAVCESLQALTLRHKLHDCGQYIGTGTKFRDILKMKC